MPLRDCKVSKKISTWQLLNIRLVSLKLIPISETKHDRIVYSFRRLHLGSSSIQSGVELHGETIMVSWLFHNRMGYSLCIDVFGNKFWTNCGLQIHSRSGWGESSLRVMKWLTDGDRRHSFPECFSISANGILKKSSTYECQFSTPEVWFLVLSEIWLQQGKPERLWWLFGWQGQYFERSWTFSRIFSLAMVGSHLSWKSHIW